MLITLYVAVSEEGLTFIDQHSDVNSESSCCTEELNIRNSTQWAILQSLVRIITKHDYCPTFLSPLK